MRFSVEGDERESQLIFHLEFYVDAGPGVNDLRQSLRLCTNLTSLTSLSLGKTSLFFSIYFSFTLSITPPLPIPSPIP